MGHPSQHRRCLCRSHIAEKATALLGELANAERLMIVALLHELGEMHVNEIVTALGANRASLSRHLGRLREQSIVTTRRRHNRIYYALSHHKAGEMIKTLCAVME